MTAAEQEAISLFARTEGLLLDPVYTGRAAAGMIDLIRRGQFKRAGNRSVLAHRGTASSVRRPIRGSDAGLRASWPQAAPLRGALTQGRCGWERGPAPISHPAELWFSRKRSS